MGNFENGVHPNGFKELSAEKAFVPFIPQGDLVFPLGQHLGRPAAPIVKRGDVVTAGQIIAEASGFISANIISSCSGKVKAVDATSITIANDGLYTMAEGIGEECDPTTLDSAAIIAKVKAAGIVGLGGAGFPTHVKLAPKNPAAIDTVIANGTECEPYITCDDRLMREKSAEIIGGLKILLQLFPGARGVVVIEDNKPAAIESMKAAAEGTGIEIMPVETRYPQGGERQIIYTVTKRQNAAGVLPADLGVVVDNVGTIYAIYQAVCKNTPLMEKGFTVTGDGITNPSNFWVKIGTPLSDLVEACGGFAGEPKKLILGGPMMGASIEGVANRPIMRQQNALTVLQNDEVETALDLMTECIRCGKCIKACPLGLYPQIMAQAARKKDYERYEQAYGLQCMGCGSCTFACPAKRPLMQLFKMTKAQIMADKAKAKEGGK